MNSSSSPPVLYIEDDDDDIQEPSSSYQTNYVLSRTSSEMNLPCKKRRLSNINNPVHPSVANWPKRQRNNHIQQRTSHNFLDSDYDSEPILLDPNEYIIEKPDAQTYRSFDWTIQMEQPPALIPTRIPKHPLPTILNGNSPLKRSIDRPNHSLSDKFTQSVRKTTVVPPPPLPPPPLLPRQTSTFLPLPLPTPTTSINRSNAQRGRPLKTSRIPTIQPTSPSRPEQPTFATKRAASRPPALPSTPSSSSSLLLSSFEGHRQPLNGAGIFSAFHDSKYYRCNICKFKSATSSTLLQHLFTHMFFCDRCSFYTYSYYNLSQHLFEKHHINLLEEISGPINPKSFDLLYVTRCQDGKFALCMDSSSSSSSKQSTNDQNLIISSAVPNEQSQIQSSKKPIPEENADRDHVFVLNDQPTVGRLKRKVKSPHTFILMKHGKYFSMKKPICLHSLTLEYKICCEQSLRQLGQTSNRNKQRIFSRTRLIDEVAHCLKTIVNQIILDEENNSQSTFICALPNQMLQTIVSEENFDILMKNLQLKNKYSQAIEKKRCSFRQDKNEYKFILSSPDFIQNDQSILSSLTNADSIYAQTKIEKLSANYDNTHRYLRTNSNSQVPMNNSKKANSRLNTTKPIRSTVDKNNNSVTSSIPSVIVLD